MKSINNRFDQSNNYDTTLVEGHGSNDYKAIFRQLCHTQKTIPLFYCEVLGELPESFISDFGFKGGKTLYNYKEDTVDLS